MHFFRVILVVLQIKVELTGEMQDKSMLYVSNHISYIDIFIHGAYLPTRFTPKKEIMKWPIVNILIKVSGSVFIDRRVTKLKSQMKKVYRILKKHSVMIFPEGTTSDGTEILPFKSSFFAVVARSDCEICPVVLRYRNPEQAAWYGDMIFMPHVMQFLSLGTTYVTLEILPCLSCEGKTRKDLAQQSYEIIKEAFYK